MRVRAFLIPLVTAAIFAACWPASAQTRAPRQPEAKAESKPRPPARPLTRAQRLDGLFEALKQAPSAQAAQAIEARLEATLLQSGSDTADLLMSRARGLIEAKDYDLSLQLLDRVVGLTPGYTEAFAQRATVRFLKKDLFGSLADLRIVVAREPRHYTALAGLGIILQDLGDDKRALDALRRAIAINPHLKGIPEIVKRLELKVEGREI
jgi:tetratricopeptide (TPR) repeat protein